jgi:hypothetical protein
MERKYKHGTDAGIEFFTGTEIEHTPAYGMKTLFVVGLQDPENIIVHAKEKDCSHIYFGANQSFVSKKKKDLSDWAEWEDMIKHCLALNFWCTLDIDCTEVEGLLECGLCEWRRFIPHISIKLPSLQKLGYNATIKVDDIGFECTNPGVWSVPISELTQQKYFTNWDDYSKDEIIK